MAGLKHRIADAEDLEILAEWNHQLIEDEGARNPMTIAELRERMAGWIETREYRAVIFHDQQLPVAYALYAERDDEIHLRQFFVMREHRRRGFGREAMNVLMTKLWPEGKSLSVDVLAHNTAAYTFWRECGYEAECIRMRRPVNGRKEARKAT